MFDNKRGRNQGLLIADPLVRRGVELWLGRVYGFYGEKNGGVDVEVIDDQVILNDESMEYLYSEYTPRALKYTRGSRPLLEQAAAEVLKPGMREREKALALMRRCRDNRDRGLK